MWLRLQAKLPFLTTGSIVFLAATTGVNLSNFGFHLVVSRILGPEGYGSLAALLSVVTVISIPLAALEISVAQVVAERVGSGFTPRTSSLRRQAQISGLVAAVIWTALSPLGADFFHLSTILCLMLAPWVGITIVTSVLQGEFIGQRRFAPVAAAQFFGAGVMRVGAALALLTAGLGVGGALAATTVSSLGILGILVVLRRKTPPETESEVVLRPRDAVRSMSSVGAVTLLSSIDVWFAKHYLGAAASGSFSAAATAGRIAMFLPGALVFIVFPDFSRKAAVTESAGKTLRGALALTMFLSGGAAAIIGVFPSVVTKILFGARFASAASVMPIVASAYAVTASLGVMTYFNLARRSRLTIAPWIGSVLAALLTAAFHRSMRALAIDMLVAGSCALVLSSLGSLINFGASTRWRRVERHS